MISSKKRKIIKLIALSTGSVTLGVASTLGIVYSTQQKESQASLFQRSNKVSLNTNASNANDSQNSNRDFNLENAPEKPESKPVVVVNPPEKKPEPTPPEPKKPTIEDMLPQSSEGFVDINNLPDLDFSTLKPKENPGGKLTKEQP